MFSIYNYHCPCCFPVLCLNYKGILTVLLYTNIGLGEQVLYYIIMVLLNLTRSALGQRNIWNIGSYENLWLMCLQPLGLKTHTKKSQLVNALNLGLYLLPTVCTEWTSFLIKCKNASWCTHLQQILLDIKNNIHHNLKQNLFILLHKSVMLRFLITWGNRSFGVWCQYNALESWSNVILLCTLIIITRQ